MPLYTAFCGDRSIVTVPHNVEKVGCLSKDEVEAILAKVRETLEYKDFTDWLGFGFITIKRKAE